MFSYSVMAKEIIDIMGNKIEVPDNPTRVILASGYSLPAISFIVDDLSIIIGMGAELKRFDPETFVAYAKTFTHFNNENFIVQTDETIMELGPDLVIFELWQAENTTKLVDMLHELGIAVVFVDHYNNPVDNITKSASIFGDIFAKQDKAKKVIDFYEELEFRLESTLQTADIELVHSPKVFIHAYPGVWDCCWSVGNNGIGRYVQKFKGINIASSVFPDTHGGTLSLEYILEQDPTIYIATGHSGTNTKGALAIGTNIDILTAKNALMGIAADRYFQQLVSMQRLCVYGIWNYFTSSPLNIMQQALIAKWLQPDVYNNLDLSLIWQQLNNMLPVRLPGAFWAALDCQR